MNKPIFFSIIIPTYNRAHLISKTLDGMVAQTYPHYEILIVDDGSKDNTEEVVQKYLSDKVRYYKKNNAERAAARNFGTQHAKGDYINWFDSDDLMFPDHLEKAAECVTQFNTPEIFTTGFVYQDADGKRIFGADYREDLNQDLYRGNMVAIDCIFVRKDIADAMPFNEDRALSASEDFELWLRIGAKYKIHYIHDVTAAIVYHLERSVVAMSNAEQLVSRFEKFVQYTTAEPEVVALLGSNKNVFLMKNYLLLSINLVSNKHSATGKKYLLKSASYSWEIIKEKSFYAFIKHYILNSLSRS